MDIVIKLGANIDICCILTADQSYIGNSLHVSEGSLSLTRLYKDTFVDTDWNLFAKEHPGFKLEKRDATICLAKEHATLMDNNFELSCAILSGEFGPIVISDVYRIKIIDNLLERTPVIIPQTDENSCVANSISDQCQIVTSQNFKKKFKVFVVGYTGATGQHLTKMLAEDSRFDNITLFGRRTIDLNIGDNAAKFSQKNIDFEKLDESADLFKEDFDGGFCCLGTTRGKSGKEGFIKVDYDYTLKVAELAHAGNCKQFHLVSSAGADANSYFLLQKTKGLVENAIRKLPFPTLSIYRPKMLMGERTESRPLESIMKVLFKPIEYISPSLITTPFNVLCKAMVTNFVKHSQRQDNDKETNELLLNDEIFMLANTLE